MLDPLTITLLIIGALCALGLSYNPHSPNVGDADLEVTGALPNGATSANSASIDLGHTADGALLAKVEFELSAPALATGELGDAATMTYDVLASDNADLSTPTVMSDNLITQTGAGGAGAAAATARFRLPSDVKRYIGVRATNSAVGDASGKSMTLKALF